MRRSTPSTATRAPKRLVSPAVSTTYGCEFVFMASKLRRDAREHIGRENALLVVLESDLFRADLRRKTETRRHQNVRALPVRPSEMTDRNNRTRYESVSLLAQRCRFSRGGFG